ncbi:4-(cytidine 5'-diphospho)-2-C-methyl-D-erythritol kinase [Microbacterium sp. ARD32]|uniref:4-(cytidine 5'-diphospho)-2-C-methyl-D-erythritol kinase n=1 Tax=Microbacterium sp. ARD32 TaxID=2962577 RepID=UPI0028823A12|nr:4-(cytidine 5'-diphospho)-2-C-methyl-D-erythritol kinase [Microbacterium sp. ARD32]MDT0158720.1 4-(cytidine 5'-diphospho)-2-C-methyl-D-erythritol kinase [Microbacterium sp. ARD32]
MSFARHSDAVHVRAPGKINVHLGVGARHEDGYHSLATVFQAVSLYEDVYATASDGFSISVVGDVDVSEVPLDDRNLALRAARLLAQTADVDQGVHLDIRKGVPVAGGMGGGSADAAAALVACDALWGTELGSRRLHELAARLGADVPFALHGGTAIGTGRGDVLTPALARGRFDWVLVLSEQGLSTPEIYGRLDRMRMRGRALADDATELLEVPPAVLQALRAGDPAELAPVMMNDLEPAAVADRPDLELALADGVRMGALTGIVSGSGPTIAFLCAGPEAARAVQEELRATGRQALHVHGAVPGAQLMG